MITQEFDINIVPHGLPPRVEVDQYDTGLRTLIAHIYQDDTPLVMTSNYTYTVIGKKPSGTGFSYAATAENGAIVIDVTGQMTVVSGLVECGIIVWSGTDRVGTHRFNMWVQPSALPAETIIDSDDFGAIITDAVTDWMDEHGIPIDPTLSNEDYAAEAAATGKGITSAINAFIAYSGDLSRHVYARTAEDNAGVWVKTPGTIYMSAKGAGRNVYWDEGTSAQNLISDIDPAYVETHDGIENCVHIPSGSALVYNTTSKTFAVKGASGNLQALGPDDVSIFEVYVGADREPTEERSSDIVGGIGYYAYARWLRLFDNVDVALAGVPYWEAAGGTVYIKLPTKFRFNGSIRYQNISSSSAQGPYVSDAFDELTTTISPLGVDGCVALDADHVLAFSVPKKKFVVDTAQNAGLKNLIVILGVDFNISTTDIRPAYGIALDYYTTVDEEYEAIPSYWRPEIEAAMDRVRARERTTNHIFTDLIHISDIHWTTFNAQKSPALINHITRELGISDVILNGDFNRSHFDTKAEGAAELTDALKQYDRSLHLLPTVGNHDLNSAASSETSAFLTENEVYNFLFRRTEPYLDTGRNIEHMCYDLKAQKLRIILFKHYSAASFASDTLNYISDRISELPAGWAVVLACHVCWSLTGEQQDIVIGTLADDITAAALGADDPDNPKVICWLVGHMHRDYDSIQWAASLPSGSPDPFEYNGRKLLTVSINCDACAQSANMGGATMTRGTDTEQAFDIVQIDRDAREVYFTRVGAGNDRAFREVNGTWEVIS